MRRFLLILGFLLPFTAHADALSPWVQEVLVRAEKGVSYSDSLLNESCGDETIFSDIEGLLNIVREFHTPALDLETESRFLRENTVCFEYDRRLLSEEQKRIRQKMEDASMTCRADAMRVLRETYKFVSEALVSLTKGGLDPGYKDDRLLSRQLFEDEEAWKSGMALRDPDSSAPLCPYTTDYGPHSVGHIPVRAGQGAVTGEPSFDVRSFGCDLDILRCIAAPLDDLPPNCSSERAAAAPLELKAEARTLADYIDAVESFAGLLYGTLSDALSLTGPRSSSPPPLEHAVQNGCLRPLSPLDGGPEDPASIDSLLATYPDYFEPENLRMEEIAPGVDAQTYGPKPGAEFPVGILLRPVSDFFQSRANAGNLIQQFLDHREASGHARPLPSIYSGRTFDASIFLLWRTMDSGDLPSITGNIEREMATLEAWDRDSIERMQSVAVPLNAAVRSLVHVTEEFLPKEYIPRYAYFLRRSCVDGHCSKTLETVVKRSFNPYCHPYASGLYTDPKTHLKCFCDPSIRGEFPEWDQYCSDDLSGEQWKYDAMQPELMPACMPDATLYNEQ